MKLVLARPITLCLITAATAAAFAQHPPMGGNAPKVPAEFRAALDQAQQWLNDAGTVDDSERTFDNTIRPIDDAIAHVMTATRHHMLLGVVSPKEENRVISRMVHTRGMAFLYQIPRRDDLYHAFQAFQAREHKLTPAQQEVVHIAARAFRHAGMQLPRQKRQQLRLVEGELSALSIRFQRARALDRPVLKRTRDALSALPPDLLDAMLTGDGPLHEIPLTDDNIDILLTYCPDAETRKQAWITRATHGADDALAAIADLVTARRVHARLIGYPSPAHVAADDWNVVTLDEARGFIDALDTYVAEKAGKERKTLEAAKHENLQEPEAALEPWDVDYYARWVRREQIGVDNEAVREYYPLDWVMQGVQKTLRGSYRVMLRETPPAGPEARPKWHEDVARFELVDRLSEDVLGVVYFDLLKRPGKDSQTQAFWLQPRKRLPDGKLQLPEVALLAGFTSRAPNEPALLTLDQVDELFGAMGMVFQYLMNNQEYAVLDPFFAPLDLRGVPDDVFAFWPWYDPQTQMLSRNYLEPERLPDELKNDLRHARTLNTGLAWLRRLEQARLELQLATAADDHAKPPSAILAALKQRTTAMPLPDGVDPVWLLDPLAQAPLASVATVAREVVAADILARLLQDGLLSPTTNWRYREAFLMPGNQRAVRNALRNFLGRDPEPQSMVKHTLKGGR